MKTTRPNFFPNLPLSSLFLTFLTLLAVLSANAQVPSYVPTNGLVGYWPFSGNANDESGNGNNGTVNGATLASDRNGVNDAAYNFDGTEDRVEVPSSQSFSMTELSISVWFKTNNFISSSGYGPTLISKRESDGWGSSFQMNLGIDQSQNSCWADWSISGNGGIYYHNSVDLQNSIWTNLIYVHTGSIVKLFLNGAEVQSVISPGLMNSNSLPLWFGGRPNAGNLSAWFNGSLDDIGIWNRALTADEVLALYNGCNVAPLTVAGNVTPTQFTQETYTYPNTGGSTYNWTVTNGVIVSGQGTNSITVVWANSGIGGVSVVETNSTNCSGDAVNYDVVIIPTDVEEFSSTLSLFPNPTTTELNLQTTSDLIGTDLFVFDALGKQIHKQQILSTNTRINTSAFAAGNYVVKVGGVVKRFEVKK